MLRVTYFVLSFALLLPAGLSAQERRFSIGAKVGTNFVVPQREFPGITRQQDRWIGGTTFELHLPKRFTFEIDLLYRGYRSDSTFPTSFGDNVNPAIITTSVRSRGLDVPLLLKYHLLDRSKKMAPFVSGGFQWTNEFQSANSQSICSGPRGSCSVPGFPNVPSFNQFDFTVHRRGPVAAAGVDFKTRHVTITPEVRYTRLIRPNDNQISVMVGFTFGR